MKSRDIFSLNQNEEYECGFFALFFIYLIYDSFLRNKFEEEIVNKRYSKETMFGEKQDWLFFYNYIQIKIIQMNKMCSIFEGKLNPYGSYIKWKNACGCDMFKFVLENDNILKDNIILIKYQNIPNWFRNLTDLGEN